MQFMFSHIENEHTSLTLEAPETILVGGNTILLFRILTWWESVMFQYSYKKNVYSLS